MRDAPVPAMGGLADAWFLTGSPPPNETSELWEPDLLL